MLTKVHDDQFVFEGDLRVRHVPTDATVSTYKYDDPMDLCLSHTNNGRADECLDNGDEFSIDEIRNRAWKLLRHRALLLAGRETA